jgi:hypothetical protein
MQWVSDGDLRKGIAIGQLVQLARYVRRTGLSAILEPDRHPFPGLVVGGTRAAGLIVAGTNRYWWGGSTPRPIGPLNRPREVAQAVATFLNAEVG